MKTRIEILLSVTIINTVLLVSACTKDANCGQQQSTTYNISSDEKAKIPYTGKDTLTFVRMTTGDTFTFYGTGWQSGNNTDYTAADCPQKELFETRQVTFQSLSFSKPINLNQYVNNVNHSTYLDIYFQTTTFETSQLGNIYDADSGSVVVQGKTYRNIHFFSNDNSMVSPKPRNYGCLYTWNDGIIKMFFTTGETWELVPKK